MAAKKKPAARKAATKPATSKPAKDQAPPAGKVASNDPMARYSPAGARE